MTLSIPQLLFSQKENNNWIFGSGTGLCFNDISNGLPRVFNRNEISENFAKNSGQPISHSDENGNLLFYTDNVYIYNRNHQIMPNGDIFQNHIFIHGIMTPWVLRSQSNSNNYYLIYLQSIFTEEYDDYIIYLTMSIIDMEADAGMGDIITKDSIIIFNYYKFYSYTNLVPIRLDDGSYIFHHIYEDFENDFKIGRIQFKNDKFKILEPYTAKNHINELVCASPKGNILVACASHYSFNILTINTQNGDIISENNIMERIFTNWATNYDSFSPDGTKFYYNEFSKLSTQDTIKTPLMQYDLLTKTITQLSGLFDHNLAIKTGPDGKIYLSEILNSNKISVIHNPNFPGLASNFEKEAIDLGDKKFDKYFPNTLQYSTVFSAYYNSPLCQGGDLELTAFYPPYLDSVSFLWTGPNGFTSTEQNPIINNVNSSHSGIYNVLIKAGGQSYSKKLDIHIDDLPATRIHPANDTILCISDNYKLTAYPQEAEDIYQWSNGATIPEIIVTESGEYILTTTNANGCTISDTVVVEFVNPKAEISAPLAVCEGDFAELRAIPDDSRFRYLWSTGESGSSILVNKAGSYNVRITFTDSCSAMAVVSMANAQKPKAEIISDSPICDGLGIKIRSKEQRAGYKYFWSNGETSSEIVANQAGKYQLIVENGFGCRDTSVLLIAEKADARIQLIGDKCINGERILRAENFNSNNIYLWSTGATSPEITVTSSGIYTLTVENEIGCKDSSKITLFGIPTFSIIGSNSVCKGETVELSSDKEYKEYLWSNGEKTRTIAVSEAGDYSLTVTDENGCSTTESFTVNLNEVNLEYPHNISINTQTYKDYEFDVSIKNKTNETVIIESININNDNFTITNSINSLNALGTKALELILNSDNVGTETAEIEIITSSPCRDTFRISINAKLEQGLRAKVWLPKMEVIPGDTARIPLYASFSENINKTLTYTSYILIKRDILWLDSPQTFDINSITLNGTAEVSTEERQIGEVSGLVLFGNSPSETVISSIDWSETGISTETENGELTITGICKPEIRNIQLITTPLMWLEHDIWSENPEVEYMNLPKGTYSITISTLLGEQIINDSRNLSGDGTFRIPINELRAGTFLYRISNASTIWSGRIILVR